MQVRAASRSDISGVSQALALAFADDPVMSWMLPDDASRTDRLRRLFTTVLRHYYLRSGRVELAHTDGVVGGATIWTPPGKWHEPALASALMTPGIIWAFGRRLRAGSAVQDLMKQNHPTAPHWYLMTIGTTPAARGRGYGQALLDSQLNRCDAAGLPAYLESSKESNIGYYERFGFTVTGKLTIPGGPAMWPMWREPR